MMTLYYLKQALGCACLIIWFGIGLKVYSFIDHTDKSLQQTLQATTSTLNTLSSTTSNLPKLVDDRAWSLQQDIGLQADDLRNALVGQSAAITRIIDARLAAIEGDANSQLTTFNSNANNQLTQLNATISDTAKPVRETAQQVDDALPLFANCEYNPDCAFNRFQGVSKAVEQMAQAGAKAAPATTASVEAIAQDTHKITADAAKMADKYTAPPTKWQRFQAALELIGVVIVKALVP